MKIYVQSRERRSSKRWSHHIFFYCWEQKTHTFLARTRFHSYIYFIVTQFFFYHFFTDDSRIQFIRFSKHMSMSNIFLPILSKWSMNCSFQCDGESYLLLLFSLYFKNQSDRQNTISPRSNNCPLWWSLDRTNTYGDPMNLTERIPRAEVNELSNGQTPQDQRRSGGFSCSLQLTLRFRNCVYKLATRIKVHLNGSSSDYRCLKLTQNWPHSCVYLSVRTLFTCVKLLVTSLNGHWTRREEQQLSTTNPHSRKPTNCPILCVVCFHFIIIPTNNHLNEL